MKKICFALLAILLTACMSLTTFAAAETVIPDGQGFAGEASEHDVVVTLIDPETGEPIDIEALLIHGYAVDITWGTMEFLYSLDGDEYNGDYSGLTQKWNPETLTWEFVDEDGNPVTPDEISGEYTHTEVSCEGVEGELLEVNTSATPDFTNKVGVNGIAVTNRSSKSIVTSFGYTQLVDIYSNPNSALGGSNSLAVPAVEGQATANSSALLYTAFNHLITPDKAATINGKAGYITVSIS